MFAVGNELNELQDGYVRSYLKGGRVISDYDEFAIDQSRTLFIPSLNSVSVGLKISFILSIESGKLNILNLNNVFWVTLAALWCAGDDLNIPGLVRAVNYRDANDSPNAEPSPGVKARNGFTNVMTAEVEAYFPKASMRAIAGLPPL